LRNSENIIARCLKKFDNYGVPVSLNFKGKETFKTVPGGILSILVMLIIAVFSLLKFKRLIQREDWNLNI
jgi:hypothetical protein